MTSGLFDGLFGLFDGLFRTPIRRSFPANGIDAASENLAYWGECALLLETLLLETLPPRASVRRTR
jgi:hypothetical protein